MNTVMEIYLCVKHLDFANSATPTSGILLYGHVFGYFTRYSSLIWCKLSFYFKVRRWYSAED